MYTVAVSRDFVAQHYLIGGDWGPENQKHSHHYRIELQLEGGRLDEHGFLVDIVEIEKELDAQVSYYKDRTLNELPEFAGLNPSIEHFSRILCTALDGCLREGRVRTLRVRLWENQIAWAMYSLDRPAGSQTS